jgi:hypothetical protein
MSRLFAVVEIIRCSVTYRCSLSECRLRQTCRDRDEHGQHLLRLRVLWKSIRKLTLSYVLLNRSIHQDDCLSLCLLGITELPELGLSLLLRLVGFPTMRMGFASPDETTVAAHSPELSSFFLFFFFFFFVVEGTRSCHKISGSIEI